MCSLEELAGAGEGRSQRRRWKGGLQQPGRGNRAQGTLETGSEELGLDWGEPGPRGVTHGHSSGHIYGPSSGGTAT